MQEAHVAMVAKMRKSGKNSRRDVVKVHNPIYNSPDGTAWNLNAEFGNTVGIFIIRGLIGLELLKNCPQANDDRRYREIYPSSDLSDHGRDTWALPEVSEWADGKNGFLSVSLMGEIPSIVMNPKMDAHVTRVLVVELDKTILLDEDNPEYNVLDHSLKFFTFDEIRRLYKNRMVTCARSLAVLGCYLMSC